MPDLDGSSTSILIVEDHHDTAVLLSQLLRDRGLVVEVAEDYQQGLEVAHRRALDVLLTDISLPDGDGCDLLREVRATRPTVRSIALTAHALPRDWDRYRKAGFDCVLIKPTPLEAIEQAISGLLSAQGRGIADASSGRAAVAEVSGVVIESGSRSAGVVPESMPHQF